MADTPTDAPRRITVTLLHFDGCPHVEMASANLQAAAEQTPAADIVVRRTAVNTVEDAERLGFLGSPTILIDGVDPFAEPGAAPGLSCRVYQTEGGLAGSPTIAQLSAVLAGAR